MGCNDLALIPPMIGHFQENLSRMKLCKEGDLVRLGVALREALINAIDHGNLEVISKLREYDDKEYYELRNKRVQQAPYGDRRVFITETVSAEQAVYVIRDEGPGFDPSTLPDPTDPDNLDRVSGRGLLLIRRFMDELQHNATGNQITLTKRRAP